MSLADTINATAAEIEKGLEKEDKVDSKVEETPEETTETQEEDNEEVEETLSESDLSDEEVKEARELYKALRNPETAKSVIAALAEKTGFNKVETKTEVKESKKGIQAILANALGDEFKFLSDRLGPAIEEMLNQEKEERVNAFQKLETEKVEREVVSVFKDLERTTKGESKKLESQMMKLAEEILPGPGTSVKSYVNRLYTIASASKTGVPDTKKVIDTIRKNANDTSGRIRATGGNAEVEVKGPGTKMSLDESIKWAASQLQGKK